MQSFWPLMTQTEVQKETETKNTHVNTIILIKRGKLLQFIECIDLVEIVTHYKACFISAAYINIINAKILLC